MKKQKNFVLLSIGILIILMCPSAALAQNCDSLREAVKTEADAVFLFKDLAIFGKMRKKFHIDSTKGKDHIKKTGFFLNNTPASYKASIKEGAEIITVFDKYGCVEFTLWPAKLYKDKVFVRIFNWKKISQWGTPPSDNDMRVISSFAEIVDSD